jgi:uncharacterized protein
MEPTGPLTDEELEELDQFLLSDTMDEEAMDISMLDGFLTALANGPNTLSPSQWMPVIWGGPMTWESREQAERIMGYVFRHANDILFYLREDPDTFEPLLYEREHEGKKIPIIDEWCTGFVRGMALDEPGWRPLLETEDGDDMLFPIMLYGTEAGWDQLRDNPTLEDRHEEFAASLGDCVMAIMAWWLPVRKAKSTVRREEPKVVATNPVPAAAARSSSNAAAGRRCCTEWKPLSPMTANASTYASPGVDRPLSFSMAGLPAIPSGTRCSTNFSNITVFSAPMRVATVAMP